MIYSEETLFSIQEHWTATPPNRLRGKPYIRHSFILPPDRSRVVVTLQFHKERKVQAFLGLFDPNGFRGSRMDPTAVGEVKLELWVAPDAASPGALPGLLLAGEWQVLIDVQDIAEETDYQLTVCAERGSVPLPISLDYPEGHIVSAAPGWYKGEMHCHSTESDGIDPLETVVEAAMEAGINFLAMTDHFTVSQFRKLGALIDKPIAFLRSIELTSHRAHANLHGLKRWVDVYTDRPDWSMNQVADEVHAQGGLFCVNHPFASSCGWRVVDFDWSRADLMEVYNVHEGADNDYAFGLWDRQLSAGHRVIAVAGVDSQDAWQGPGRLNQPLRTCVYADELSEQGILAGLRRGRVYISQGAHLRLTAQYDNDGPSAEMGAVLPLRDEPATLRMEYSSPEPAVLTIWRNGYLLHDMLLPATGGGWQTVEFTDEGSRPGYYRAELHRQYKHPDYRYVTWHNHATLIAATNPVWIGTGWPTTA